MTVAGEVGRALASLQPRQAKLLMATLGPEQVDSSWYGVSDDAFATAVERALGALPSAMASSTRQMLRDEPQAVRAAYLEAVHERLYSATGERLRSALRVGFSVLIVVAVVLFARHEGAAGLGWAKRALGW